MHPHEPSGSTVIALTTQNRSTVPVKPNTVKALVIPFLLILFTVQVIPIQKASHNLRSIVSEQGRGGRGCGREVFPSSSPKPACGHAEQKTKQKVVPGIKTRSEISNMPERGINKQTRKHFSQWGSFSCFLKADRDSRPSPVVPLCLVVLAETTHPESPSPRS